MSPTQVRGGAAGQRLADRPLAVLGLAYRGALMVILDASIVSLPCLPPTAILASPTPIASG